MHIAGPSPNGGWRVIEIFESSEAASRFLKERFLPALAALGFTGDLPQPILAGPRLPDRRPHRDRSLTNRHP